MDRSNRRSLERLRQRSGRARRPLRPRRCLRQAMGLYPASAPPRQRRSIRSFRVAGSSGRLSVVRESVGVHRAPQDALGSGSTVQKSALSRTGARFSTIWMPAESRMVTPTVCGSVGCGWDARRSHAETDNTGAQASMQVRVAYPSIVSAFRLGSSVADVELRLMPEATAFTPSALSVSRRSSLGGWMNRAEMLREVRMERFEEVYVIPGRIRGLECAALLRRLPNLYGYRMLAQIVSRSPGSPHRNHQPVTHGQDGGLEARIGGHRLVETMDVDRQPAEARGIENLTAPQGVVRH